LALSKYVADAIQVIKAAKYDIIILETSGIGQSDTEIMDHLMFIICNDTDLELQPN
jgi:methylmalonyl-CoA mutase